MAMERTRIAKVENVALGRRGEQAKGTLHLTPHHLIFVQTPPQVQQGQPPARPKEVWITYPIISFCTLRPSAAASRQPSSIRLRCRDFSFVCFCFSDPQKARDVYDSIKAWTCKLGRLEKLYAFAYKPQGPEKDTAPQGWAVYDPMREWRRQGVIGDQENPKSSAWRVSTINKDYAFSPTYPSLFAVPASISDATLNHAKGYRSRARIPVLTYLHPVNDCSITRCSQPMLGVRQNRSVQDETLVAAIFGTTRHDRPLSSFSSGIISPTTPTPEREESGSSRDTPASLGSDLHRTSTDILEDAVIAKLRGDAVSADDVEEDEDMSKRPVVYGAQQKNMIVDARPTINAYAMQAAGMGSENMDNYKFATKVYLGIDNIHVMRDSLNKVVDALKDSDLTPLGPNKEQLAKSNWLKHIANMLDGVSIITRQVGLQHSHVLIHCSDGWDRTSQLSALSQICLDPYFRTLEGFMVLVEKDWISFGHRFHYRSGFLSSEKWFHIENERNSARDEERDGERDAMATAQKSIENAFLSAKGFFTKHNNDSRESVNVDSDAEIAEAEAFGGKKGTPTKQKEDKSITKVKETAPIFHQFIDATWQLMYQHPTRFEFNERFLRRLLYHLYSCQYGTFLYDSERERKESRLYEKTTSVWNYFLSRRKEFLNPEYDPEVDDNVRGKERLIFPRTQETRWWASVFGRTDDEMNGTIKPVQPQFNDDQQNEVDASSLQVKHEHSGDPHSVPVSRSRTPVLTGVETHQAAIGVGSPPQAEKGLNPKDLAENRVLDNPIDADTAQLPEMNSEIAESKNEPDVLQAEKPESASAQQQIHSDVADALADNMDPLGIGDVKQHVPTTRATLDKRREQLQALMQ